MSRIPQIPGKVNHQWRRHEAKLDQGLNCERRIKDVVFSTFFATHLIKKKQSPTTVEGLINL